MAQSGRSKTVARHATHAEVKHAASQRPLTAGNVARAPRHVGRVSTVDRREVAATTAPEPGHDTGASAPGCPSSLRLPSNPETSPAAPHSGSAAGARRRGPTWTRSCFKRNYHRKPDRGARRERDARRRLALRRPRLACPAMSPADKTATDHGLKDATDDPGLIKAWWTQWPKANVAIRAGAESDLVVLDVDGEHGARSLHELEAAHEPLPLTACEQRPTVDGTSTSAEMAWNPKTAPESWPPASISGAMAGTSWHHPPALQRPTTPAARRAARCRCPNGS